MDECFDVDKFIHEIEKRPAIFDKQLKEYSDKVKKDKLWSELSEAMQDGCEEMVEEEKIKISKLVFHVYLSKHVYILE